MLKYLLRKIIGSRHDRFVKKLRPLIEEINSFEPGLSRLSNDLLRAKTADFKKKVADGAGLDEVLPEAFAVVREASKRTTGMRHFDVQLIGGFVLHRGMIAEMATGEGKTLVATLAAYLNALESKGVHIVTVNDYLARRDREWMGPIFELLGLTVGVIQHDMDHAQRQAAYACDIAYGTNNEFGFDYLRDNMVTSEAHMVQRGLHYAIVDEVDSILIDEARTPLIISGPAEESTDKYYQVDRIIPGLKKGERNEDTKVETGDYIVDEKAHAAYLTEQGEAKAIKLLGVEDMHSLESMDYKHHVNQALRAHALYRRDVDYVIKDTQVIIVDEFTGRLMPGRRWSDGLHQAVEAKERLKIERENQTLATITFQNYFRMYKKLAGMTGTAETEANEFHQIYKLEVTVIPTNRQLIRTNHPDVVYRTEREKFNAIVEEISELCRVGRPVLVGTISIEKSERLSDMLRKRGVPHHVLNAKYHEREAEIVAQAGRYKGVTIATNMAGRGTDILLGGNAEFLARDFLKKQGIEPENVTPEQKDDALKKMKPQVEEEHRKVVEVGGLHVIGTERHEARRIDNQLRGRSGRQGDPGSSRFYVALEDDLMRLFGSERISSIMQKLGMEEGQDIQHGLVTKSIETAQKRVEEHNFEIRKHLLEYDDVMNKQREILYEERQRVLKGKDLKEHMFEIIDEQGEKIVDIYVPDKAHREEWDIRGIVRNCTSRFPVRMDEKEIEGLHRDQIAGLISEKIKEAYESREKEIGPEQMRFLEKAIMLHNIDTKWKDHLHAMDGLKEGIGLRAYGQRDPLIEFKHEGFDMFSIMIDRIKEDSLEFVFKVRTAAEERKSVFQRVPQELSHPEASAMRSAFAGRRPPSQGAGGMEAADTDSAGMPGGPATYKRPGKKVGRNEPCPCGSGKKYKKCCGR